MASAFAISVFLGRTIGPEGLGIVNLANQIIMFLLVLTLFGMQHVLVKNIAIAHSKGQRAKIKSNVVTAVRFNGLIALATCIIFILLAYFFAEDIFNSPLLTTPLIIFLLALVAQTLTRVYASAINGVGKVWQSNIFVQVLSYVIVAGILIVSYLFNLKIDVVYVAFVYMLARVIVFIIAIIYWKKISHFSFKAKMNLGPMLKMALPLVLVSSTSVLATNADIIMLGIMGDAEKVGLYSVGSRIAMLTSFVLLVSNTAISPKLAFMYSEGKIDEMQKMVRQTTFGTFVIALLFLLTFLFFGKTILSLWGNEFVEAYLSLIILCVGQFFNVTTGCSGMLLIMCGHEKLHRNISLISVTLNILLNFYFIKYFGIIGAAFATTIVISIENLLKVYYAKKKVGIFTIPF